MQTRKEEYYDNQGIVIDKENLAYAKKIFYDLHESDDGKLVQYLIKTCNGNLCNPINPETRSMKHHIKFTKVNSLAFSLYLRFLKTRSQAAYSQAQRQL